MPRGARLDVLGIVHHVMARWIKGRPIFRDDGDREEFLRRLAEVVVAAGAQLLAWALIPNHYHLVLRPRELHLKDLMRRLMTGYAGWHNRRHRCQGHLFQNRYRSIVVEEEPYLLQLVRYVSSDPVRAGLVRGADALDAFPYSGHAVIMGRRRWDAQDVDAVLGRFGDRVGAARRAYREFVVAGMAEGHRETFRGGGLVRSAGGWQELARRRRDEYERGDERVLGGGEFVEEVLREGEDVQRAILKTPADVLAEVSQAFGIGAEEILGPARDRRVGRARAEFYLRARAEAGQNLAELARLTGRTEPAVWQAVQRRKVPRPGPKP